MKKGKIGIFDSGYGGLTVMRSIVDVLPGFDFVYLGDNARAPYGNRSFETVYQYTLESVNWLFDQGCELVVLACNTASAKALRQIQQIDLPKRSDNKRVLGVIRPSTESIGRYTKTGVVGIMGTVGTVKSETYPTEIARFFPSLRVEQEACPMWVYLVEHNQREGVGAEYFVKLHLDRILSRNPQIDTILLACTHYPLLEKTLNKCIPSNVRLVSQGRIVAESLNAYLNRHPEIRNILGSGASRSFFTTDDTLTFEAQASIFFGDSVRVKHVQIG
ncbi:MAG: glutamate racemase [Flavobacteriales bacterium]|nr:MAG: glutamate racemase [Flavobacteriales bacterium]